MTSIQRIKGANGVIIDSNAYLELPKAPTKTTADAIRSGMIRYNIAWKAFEGVLDFEDGSVEYRRFAQLDGNGRLLTSQLPESVTSGLAYVGTYSPISDDIDPPYPPGVYTPLPAATTDNNGEYYIVRGIFSAAAAHYAANTPTTTTVTFTPANPSGDGDWIEIKYYVDLTLKQVQAAFGRIITPIPSGHPGLTLLADDAELTNAFSTSATIATETALTDGDWVIMAGAKVQRLRSTRVSILASSVMYDNSVINDSGRGLINSSNTIQTIIDMILLDGLRRTGDSMIDDGSPGNGRLAITYGSAAAPSLSFNNSSTSENGIDPSKWSDGGTGIFWQAAGSMGFSSAAVEKFRIDGSGITALSGSNLVFDDPTTPTTITQASGLLSFNMTSYSDISIMDGSVERTKFNRYGIKLPVLNPVDDAVGEDGMIAFSSERNTVVQKALGHWTSVGGSAFEIPFVIADWVLSLDKTQYTITFAEQNVQSLRVQELDSGNYSPVEVDFNVVTPTNAVITVPAAPDMRFDGRALVNYQ